MRGMKKILLAAVGMTGLLASCGDISISSGYYGTSNSTSTASLNSLTNFTSNYIDGKGTPIICYDRPTTVSFDLSWSGYLSTVGFQAAGYNTGAYTNTDEYSVNSGSGSAPVYLTFASGTAPLSVTKNPITSQSIIVNPTTKGYTYVRAQGRDRNGNATNVVQTSYSIPVMNCG